MNRFHAALRRAVLLCAFAFAFTLPLPLAFASTHTVMDALGRQVEVKTTVERVIIGFSFEEFTAVAGVDGWAKVVGMSRSA